MKIILKNKSGMTLIEMIVAVLIVSILSVAVVSVLVPTLKTYTKANELAELNSILSIAGTEITTEMSRAVIAPSIESDGRKINIPVKESNSVTYFLNNGILMKQLDNNTSVHAIPKDVYNGKSLDVKYRKVKLASGDGTAYMVDISVLNRENRALLSRTFAVKPLVLNQRN